MKKYSLKRFFDLILALFGVFFFSPFFILFSFLIWCEGQGPVFYKQTRVGKDKKEFQILKFRSMSIDSEKLPSSSMQKGDSRIKITKSGKFLRATAMDELPQLINILKGEMSFVGPRPLMPEEGRSLGPAVSVRRLSIRPGLTGIAQVCADKYISNDQKAEYDLKYIRKKNLWLDLKTIFYSLVITLKKGWETAENRPIRLVE